MKSHQFSIIVIFLLNFSTNLFSQKTTDINWPDYISRHDLVFEQLPLQWNEGAFNGNGQVGFMMFATMKDNRIDFHIGRQDVTDHRKAPDRKTSMGVPGASVMFDFPRLDIGRMALHPVGKILSGSLRQDLWNAEIRGTIITDLGTIKLRAYTPYQRMLSIIEITSTEIKDGKPAAYKWKFRPGNPTSPRVQVFPTSDPGYITNPKPILSNENGFGSCVQPLLAGGDYATVWHEQKHKINSSTLFVSIANEVPAANKSKQVAENTIHDALKTKMKMIEKEHRNWWHAFYQKSFLSFPNEQMESFYWIQMYKMATCSRPDGPALDLFGPYFRVSQWPGLWWNLNVQLTYWNVLQSNHLEQGENLITLIDSQFESLLKKFDNANLGDFAWTMHNYWLQLRYGGNRLAIYEKWLPKAIEVAKLYEKRLIRNEKGQLEMKEMQSPEYGRFQSFKNSSYNLALYRWLLTALIECAIENNSMQSEITAWQNNLKDLISLPTNENGIMIGSEQGFDYSHRHYSHLLGLYPLFVLNPDNENDRALVDKSVVHWHQIDGGKGLAGYSYTGAASLYAALGRGNDVEKIMHHFLNGNFGMGNLLSNTFYAESGSKNPVIETPLSAANAISEMLLQSWGGKLRVFPAMPDKWKDASFDKLRTQGAFLVSAVRKNGQTQWVKIKSLAGEPCVVKIPGWTEVFQKSKGQKINITYLSNNEFDLDLKAGEEIILLPDSNLKIEPVAPITSTTGKFNYYGVKKGKELKSDQNWPLPESM